MNSVVLVNRNVLCAEDDVNKEEDKLNLDKSNVEKKSGLSLSQEDPEYCQCCAWDPLAKAGIGDQSD